LIPVRILLLAPTLGANERLMKISLAEMLFVSRDDSFAGVQ
jgi:hypothetical protein